MGVFRNKSGLNKRGLYSSQDEISSRNYDRDQDGIIDQESLPSSSGGTIIFPTEVEAAFYPVNKGDNVHIQNFTGTGWVHWLVLTSGTLGGTATYIEIASKLEFDNSHTQDTDTGTTAQIFRIDKDGNYAELNASGLTTNRIQNLPDKSGTFAMISDVPGAINVNTIVFGDSPYSATNNEVILADATAGQITINLPAASTGATVKIKKIDASANTVVMDGDALEEIDGLTTEDLIAQYESYTLISDGSNWFIF
jgi:hypothetical protein